LKKLEEMPSIRIEEPWCSTKAEIREIAGEVKPYLERMRYRIPHSTLSYAFWRSN
jgi:hypothetical protein